LSEQHPYLSVFPNIVVRDFNQQVITDFSVTKNEDNSSLFIRFTPEKSPNKFTISINRGLGIDQNGMTNESATVSFAYGRPVTRLDALTAWWSFDDQNQSYVTEYYDRFNGIFVDNEITDPDTQEVTTYDVTYSNGIFGSALSFPGNAWVKTSASASGLGISGNNPRTISFWMKAENQNSSNSVVYVLGDRPGNSGGNFTAWGIQGPWSWTWMRSFYNNNSQYNNFKNNQSYYNNWRHIAHIYDGRTVYVFVDGVQRLVVNRELNTMSRTSLTFGHFGDSDRGWNNDHFVGLPDDFRVYNDAFSQD